MERIGPAASKILQTTVREAETRGRNWSAASVKRRAEDPAEPVLAGGGEP